MWRTLIVLLGLAAASAANPPIKIMYFHPQAEMRLSLQLRKRQFQWPIMRLGVAESGNHQLGMVRFKIAPGVRRAEICRQAKEAALISFHVLPRLVHLDVDATEVEDTKTTKAVPWFSASLDRVRVLSTDPLLPPEEWLMKQGLVTLDPRLGADPSPSQVIADSLHEIFSACFNRAPVQRKPRVAH